MLGFVLIAAVTVALSAVAASRMSVVTMRHIAPAAYVAGGIPAAVAVTAFVRGHANAAAAIGCIAAALCTVTDVATGLIFDEVAALGLIACWCASALPGVQHVTGAVAGAWSGFALLAVPPHAGEGVCFLTFKRLHRLLCAPKSPRSSRRSSSR